LIVNNNVALSDRALDVFWTAATYSWLLNMFLPALKLYFARSFRL
jgi:hypothetical protein